MLPMDFSWLWGSEDYGKTGRTRAQGRIPTEPASKTGLEGYLNLQRSRLHLRRKDGCSDQN